MHPPYQLLCDGNNDCKGNPLCSSSSSFFALANICLQMSIVYFHFKERVSDKLYILGFSRKCMETQTGITISQSGQFKMEKHEQQFLYNFPCDRVFSFRIQEGQGGLSYPWKLRLKKHCEIVINCVLMTVCIRLPWRTDRVHIPHLQLSQQLQCNP